MSLELVHVQTNTCFELPPDLAVIRIGKLNEQIPPDIDVSNLPDTDVVSRIHAEIVLEASTYYLADLGSANGTFLNNTRLEPNKRYPIELGDRIDLGKEAKVAFIFQQRQNGSPVLNSIVTQAETSHNSTQPQADRSSKLVGLVLMVAGIVILTANTNVGLFVRIPGVVLCFAGVIVLIRRTYRSLGWILIALGIVTMMFTANIFASVSLLTLLVSSALFVSGYQLFTSGKIWNFSLQSLKDSFKN
ncbi:FHA domain-containing protein [Aetokthonos hydrillicola]|jgi:hypothetical protein|nr:FHA domain-containing protein [Aetokthonos hydrillicola]